VVSLLSGRVPNLKLDRVVIDADCLSEERSCSAERKRQRTTRMRHTVELGQASEMQSYK